MRGRANGSVVPRRWIDDAGLHRQVVVVAMTGVLMAGSAQCCVACCGQPASFASTLSTRCFSKGAAMASKASAVAPVTISVGMNMPERA